MSGYPLACRYEFPLVIFGPFSPVLSEELESMDWSRVKSEPILDDWRISIVKEALDKGDEFILSLSIIMGVVRHNGRSRISRGDAVDVALNIVGGGRSTIEYAYDFAEERIWSVACT
jgi:hypothetical protein